MRYLRLLLLVALVVSIWPVRALALSSATYTIPQFDLPEGAGAVGSTNYKLQAEVAPSVGSLSSSSYAIDTGFPSTTGGVIILIVNSGTVSLTLTPGTPTTGTTTTTVSTNDSNGYSIAIEKTQLLTHSDATHTISDVSGTIASPASWSGTGFGFTVTSGTSIESSWSSGTAFAAIPTQTATTFHSVTNAINSANDTQITYKLDTPASQKAGQYTTLVSFTATVNP